MFYFIFPIGFPPKFQRIPKMNRGKRHQALGHDIRYIKGYCVELRATRRNILRKIKRRKSHFNLYLIQIFFLHNLI